MLCSIQRLPSIGSDHFPLFTSLLFAPIDGAGQKGLESDAEDHERAKQTVNEKEGNSNDLPQPNET